MTPETREHIRLYGLNNDRVIAIIEERNRFLNTINALLLAAEAVEGNNFMRIPMDVWQENIEPLFEDDTAC